MTITITNQLDGANEVLATDTTGTSISANFTGNQLTLSGDDSVANYQLAGVLGFALMGLIFLPTFIRLGIKTAPQFLICFEYDQDEMPGPPFSVTEAEVRALYTGPYTVSGIERKTVTGRLKGLVDATENAWLLR